MTKPTTTTTKAKELTRLTTGNWEKALEDSVKAGHKHGWMTGHIRQVRGEVFVITKHCRGCGLIIPSEDMEPYVAVLEALASAPPNASADAVIAELRKKVDAEIDWVFSKCDRRETVNLDDILKLRINAIIVEATKKGRIGDAEGK